MPATNKLDFSNAQAAAKALKKVSQIMIRAGQPVVSSDFSDKPRRTSGITYREAVLTVASGQAVVLRVNATGDIYQVLLNGSLQPMKNQTDSDKAVMEIAALLERNQVAFQKAQARKQIALPKGMTTTAPKQATVYAERVAQLDVQIAERLATVADLQQQLGAMTDSLPPAVELDDAAKDVLAQLQAGAVEDGDLVSKQGRDTLVEAKLAGRDDGANWLTAEGEKLAAALLDGIGGEQPKGFPRKWGGKLYNFDQFKLVPADEHGELPGAWTLIDGAVPVADSLLDSVPMLNPSATDTLRVMAMFGVVDSKALPSVEGLETLVGLGFVERMELLDTNVITELGKAAAAELAPPPMPVNDGTAKEPISWTGFKLVNQAFVDQTGPMPVPSQFQIGADVFLPLGQNGEKIDVPAKVIGASFRASKVHYTLAVAVESIGGQKVYAVLHEVDSISVAPASDMMDSAGQPTVLVIAADHKEPLPADDFGMAGAYVAAREIVLADPAMMDSMATAGAIEQLRQALSVVETNAPINEAEGNHDQAALERRLAKSFTTAIAMLDSVSPDLGDSGLSELVNIAIVSAADVSDIKDEDALAQLLALGMVVTAEGLYMLTDKGRSTLEDAGFDAYGEPFAAED